MTVSQVNRTTNSVTINVSGITQGNRQTYIWIPGDVLNSNNGKWYTLQKAKSYGYISGYDVVSYESNNGDIRIYVSDEYLEVGHRAVDVTVINLPDGYVSSGVRDDDIDNALTWIYLTFVLDFNYENSFPKLAGEEIDITVNDLREINLFGVDIYNFVMGSTNGEYYPLSSADKGDKIKAEYLRLPAQNIWNTAYNKRELLGDYYMVVWNYTSDIIDNCVSGADFKALWFNGILYAIRNFNLSCTV